MTLEIHFEGPDQVKITQTFEFIVANNQIHAKPVDIEHKYDECYSSFLQQRQSARHIEPEFIMKFKDGLGAVEGTVKFDVESKWPGEGVPYPKKKALKGAPMTSQGTEALYSLHDESAERLNVRSREPDASAVRRPQQLPVQSERACSPPGHIVQPTGVTALSSTQPLPKEPSDQFAGDLPGGSQFGPSNLTNKSAGFKPHRTLQKPLDKTSKPRNANPQSPTDNERILQTPTCDHAVDEWLIGKIHHGREDLRNYIAVREKLCDNKEEDRMSARGFK